MSDRAEYGMVAAGGVALCVTLLFLLAIAVDRMNEAKAASTSDVVAVKSIDFDRHWSKFLLEQFGCPLDAKVLDSSTCKRAWGFIDYKEWNEARKRAKELFQLEDKK